jgi:hypothetical protein
MNHNQQLTTAALGPEPGAIATIRGVGLALACSLAAIILWTCVAYGIFAAPVIGWFLAFGIVRLYATGARRLTAGGLVFVLVLIAATVVAATLIGFGRVLITQEADAAGLDPWPLLLDLVVWQSLVLPAIELNAILVLGTLLVLGTFAALGALQTIRWYLKATRAREHPLRYGPMSTGDMLTIAEFGDAEHRVELARRRKLPTEVKQMLASHGAPNQERNLLA